jgi:hypothetical protein
MLGSYASCSTWVMMVNMNINVELALPLCYIFVLTQNPHPASSTQQAEQASFTREPIPKRAVNFP